MHRRETSAYRAALLPGPDDVVLVTETGFTTFRSDRPTEDHAIALGPVTARQGDALVFWRAGSLREVSLVGGGERELAPTPRPPRYLLASEARLAWIATDGQAATSLQTLSAGRVRVVHECPDGVSAAAMHDADVYWVARGRDGSWNIGGIDLDGRRPVSSASHQGRPPALLAVGRDGVYFYDGPQRGVRRLTFDLQRESPVFSGAVCSPLAVADRVLCAQTGGLFDIPLTGKAPRFLASERAGPITALALAGRRAYWVAEDGGERLVVRSVALLDP